jgi:Ca-activated chloride channel family protein
VSEVFANFHFMRPFWLLSGLAIVPVALLVWRQLRSGQAWNAVISESLLPYLLSGSSSRPARWPLAALCAAWLLASLALAGPSWQKLPQPVERKEDALVVVLDLSTSMYAEDIAPSRLVRARQKLLDLLSEKTEGTTGLVAYAGDAHVVSPLTDDLRTVANLLPALEPGIMPVRGSRPGPAVEQAVRLLRDSGLEHGQILLVTDGVREADQQSISGALAGTGYRLSVLGVGTSDGAPIPTSDGFLRDAEGNIVVPGLDRQPLKALAARFGGHYSDIQLGDGDIDRILNTDVWGEMETERLLDRQVDTWQDMGYWLVLMLIPVALGAFRRGWLLCLVLLLPTAESVQAQGWQALFLNRDQRGSELLQQGDAEAAAEAFNDPDWQAAANYRAGNFEAAAAHYRQGDDADSWYNRGNALARSGELQEAIAAYDEALKRNGDMEDAAYNKALLEQLLQQQQSQQGEQPPADQDQQQNEENSGQQEQSSQGEGEGEGEQQESASSGGQDSEPPEGSDDRREQSQPRNEQQESANAETEQQADDGQQREPDQPREDDGREALAQRDAEDIEREMANEQWLRRIPDDPSGLLRRKFLYESRLRAAENSGNTRKQQDEETW